ncbi:MAG: aldehyde dehydrogenase family protein [Candidatus Eremiobacteraeota bacterium]|nr:aldehyde dehydrogenase family protein [Candidatus Eremiobacteraeota bacterium]
MSAARFSSPAIDQKADELLDGAVRWARLGAAAKAALLIRVKRSVYRKAECWATTASVAKGIAGTPLSGEEWISGPWALLYALNRYIATLQEIARAGEPYIDSRRIRERPNGQVVVNVFPQNLYDRLLLGGIRAEVWMQPDITPLGLGATMATWYRQSAQTPRVALVLGAGNISSIAPLDVLYKLVAGGAVCMLKLNPVNAYLGPVLEDALAPLVEDGFLRFAYGGAEIGKYLCNHDAIDEIHITGSAATHDAIVFGDGPDAAERKSRNEPVLNKPVTSELGNVSPTIVVPGPWSNGDFRFQAENIVTQKMHNGGFNCIASQVLVLPKDWNGTPKLREQIDTVLEGLQDRPAFYPGASARAARLIENRSAVRSYGTDTRGFVARTRFEADFADASEPAFATEAFGSVLAVTSIPGDIEAYLGKAVVFANESLSGTLGANIIAHPATIQKFPRAIDEAIADLRYGCVAVNVWSGVWFFLCESTWGAFPGHPRNDIGSGTGVVHNSFLFSAPQKSVVHGPFAPFPRSIMGYGATLLPKPPWFVTNGMAQEIGRALCDFEANKDPLAMARVAIAAMRA